MSSAADALGLSEATWRKRYARKPVTVPNGTQLSGWPPGLSAVTRLEDVLRDRLAAQINGLTEVRLDYGRVDVLTAATVFEVEPVKAWRRAVRQTLGYAAQTGCQPAVALFGFAMMEDVRDICKRLYQGKPSIQLWCYDADETRWQHINSLKQCRVMWDPKEETA